MAGAGIRLENLENVLTGLRKIFERIDDATPMYDEIGGHLDTWANIRFEREVDPEGNPWPKSLRALAKNGKTLTLRGRLSDSIAHNAGPSYVEHGTNVVYGAIHQFGGDIKILAHKRELHFKTNKAGTKLLRGFRKKGKSNFSQRVEIGPHTVHIPARPFLGMGDDDVREIETIVRSYISKVIDQSF